MATDEEDKFIPIGDPIPLEELSNYASDGGVEITRGDVERAIATSDDELKKYLEAKQRNGIFREKNSSEKMPQK